MLLSRTGGSQWKESHSYPFIRYTVNSYNEQNSESAFKRLSAEVFKSIHQQINVSLSCINGIFIIPKTSDFQHFHA